LTVALLFCVAAICTAKGWRNWRH